MNNALDIINRTVGKAERVGVALSGGADSVCLFYLLLETVGKDRLVAINVEHGIRGESSKRDSKFVASLCEKEGVKLIAKSVDIPALCRQSGRSEETEARIYRKTLFTEVLRSGEVDYIATAHHLGDKVESVLMHLFRGCGINGLIGQTELDGRFLHPLINTPKSDILEYLQERNVPYCKDETNDDTAYTRNFIRHEVIPKIEERYNLSSAVITVSENAQRDDDFINSCIDASLISYGENEVRLDLSVFDLHFALVFRYLQKAVKALNRITDFESKHARLIIDLKNAQNGSNIDLIGDLHAVKEYDRITLYSGEKPQKSEEEEVFAVGLTPFLEGYIEAYYTDRREDGYLCADLDKIPDGAIIRTRREGDIFRPYGGGEKKLKEYLIDKKIPKREREKLPLLCNGSKILCIFGVEISNDIKIDDKTKNVIKMRYTED